LICEVESRNADQTGLRTDALEIRGLGREEKKRINSQHSRYCKLLKARSFEKKGKKEKKKKEGPKML
jgi:hypothetical protein